MASLTGHKQRKWGQCKLQILVLLEKLKFLTIQVSLRHAQDSISTSLNLRISNHHSTWLVNGCRLQYSLYFKRIRRLSPCLKRKPPSLLTEINPPPPPSKENEWGVSGTRPSRFLLFSCLCISFVAILNYVFLKFSYCLEACWSKSIQITQ